MARPAHTTIERAEAEAQQRAAVLRGLAQCIAERGYVATTVADVAAAARVSKSTVYAHFRDKEAVYLALYSATTDDLLATIAGADAAARTAGLDWRERVRATATAYFTAVAAGGALSRSLVIEAQAVSPAAAAKRREILDRYAKLLGRTARELAREHPELSAPTPTLLLGAIGGMNEMILRELEQDRPPQLGRLIDAATELIAALLLSPRG